MKIYKSTSALSGLGALSVMVALAAFADNAQANPEGGVVSGGSATITSTDKKLDIYQHTNRTVIDWRTFNIAPDEHTEFHQPSSSALAVNRVGAGGPSSIQGKLTANGNVIIINPSGVLFGSGSQVDVNSLIATTADIKNADFMDGKMNFSMPGNPDASVINEGTITAGEAGLIGLVAPNVKNSGVISAKLGRVQLASGDSFAVDMYGDGLMAVEVSDDVKSQLVENTGKINASGGTVAITAAAGKKMVNSLITIKGEIKTPTVSQRGGKIIIGGGTNQTKTKVIVQGKLEAKGHNPGEKGGDVTITGDHIGVLNGSVIDVSGHGGGSIKIGGDYLGGGDTQRALQTLVQEGAEINANGYGNTDAGRVILWSDEQTSFGGVINANAEGSGKGGFVETSSKRNLYIENTAAVKANSVSGNKGTWLLDPYDITIQSTAGTTAATGNPNFVANGAASYILVSTIEQALNSNTDVTITTNFANGGATGNGDITVSNAIGASGAVTGTGSLTLSAYRSINVNAAITTNGGAVILQSNNADAGGRINVAANITTNGGNIFLGGGSNMYGTGGSISDVKSDATYAIGITGATAGVYLNGATVDAGAGNVTIRGKGFAGANSNYGVQFTNSANVKTTSGAINITGVGGSGTTTANTGIYTVTGTNKITSTSGNISLTGTGGTGTTGLNGIDASAGTVISTGGSGTVTLTGNASSGSTGVSNGISYTGSITTVDGLIKLEGYGKGAGASTTGVYLTAATIRAGTTNGTSTSGTGGITIIGQASTTSTANSNYGIYLSSSSSVQTGSGAISITGTGGTGTSANTGIFTATGSNVISSVTGNLDINGTGGSGSTSINGIDASNIAISTGGSGTITLTGAAGATSTGSSIGINYSGTITALDGLIKLDGTSKGTGANNMGIYFTSSTIRSGYNGSSFTGLGSISLTGQGSLSATLNNNYGLYVYSGNTFQTNSGDITVNGTGGVGTTGNTGIYSITGTNSFTSNSGNISITGNGGSGTTSINGIDFNATTTVSTGGSGTITLTGNAGATSTGSSFGVTLTTTTITSLNGLIKIDGVGKGTGAANQGVGLTGATIRAGYDGAAYTGSGGLTINGQGSLSATTTNNYGISFTSNNTLRSGSGEINLTGKGGTGTTGLVGINLAAGSNTISSSTGNVIVTGQGGSGTTNIHGINALATVAISAGGSGNVTVKGDAGATSTGSSYGIYYAGTISALNGLLKVQGTGNGTGANNHGIYMTTTTIRGGYDGSAFTGTGDVTVIGQGSLSGTTTDNYGVYLYNGNAITNNSGTVTVDGRGGTGTNTNYGVFTAAGFNRISSSTGKINITGTSQGTVSNNAGLYLGQLTTITTGYDYPAGVGVSNGGGGAINITGTGSTNGTSTNTTGNDGIVIYNGVAIQSITGKITILGTGGNGTTANRGINMSASTNNVITDAEIYIKGYGGGTGNTANDGVYLGYVNLKSNLSNATIEGYGSLNGGGAGVFIVTGTVQTTSGKMYVYGEGGKGLNNTDGIGVNLYNGGNIKATTGKVEIVGIGGPGKGGNTGVYSSAGTNEISTTTGDIIITGTSTGTVNSNHGIYLSGGKIYTTGTTTDSSGILADDGNYYEGDIYLNGTASANGAVSNYGVFYNGSIESKGTGLVKIVGTGAGSGNDNLGVYLYNGASIKTASTKLEITGTAGNGTSGNIGVQISSGANEVSTTSGNIYIKGYGKGTTTGNHGVFMNAATTIRAKNAGIVDIQGYATDNASSTTDNYGVHGYNGINIQTDTGTLTITGEGGVGYNSSTKAGNNYGVYIYTGANTITSNALITINGTGKGQGSGSGGVYLSGTTVSATGSNNIAIKGVASTTGGGMGAFLSAGSIYSGSGEVKVEGYGGVKTSSTFTDNYGIYLYNGVNIYSTTGDVKVTGVGGSGTNNNHGIYSTLGTSKVYSTSGNLIINGTGGNGANGSSNAGFALAAAMQFTTGGAGNIDIVGQGSTTSTGGGSMGFYANGAALTITTNTGYIKLTGTGGSGASTGAQIYDGSNGISIGGAGAKAITSTSGNITIKGDMASGSTGAMNLGAYIFGTTISTGSAGVISITGTSRAASGGNNWGLTLSSSTTVTTADGDITLIGQGGGFSDGYGLYVYNSTVKSTGIGKITATGTGTTQSSATTANHGVVFENPNAVNSKVSFQTNSGDISLTGTGGTGTNTNYGINLTTNFYTSEITSTSGNIVLNGTGKGSGNTNYGAVIMRSTISTGSAGKIDITGQGSTTSTTTSNSGVLFDYANTVSTSSGDITIKGFGGTGASSTATNGNIGVYFYTNTGAKTITTATGNIRITGETNSAATGSYNYGLYVSNNTALSITGTNSTGVIELKGTAKSTNTANSSDYGLYYAGSATTIDGKLSVTGQGGGGIGGVGVYLAGGSLTATGIGGVEVVGTATKTGNTTSSSANAGIYAYNTGYTISTVSGDITLTGTGGLGNNGTSNAQSGHSGILATGTGTRSITSTSGNISLTGTSAAATGAYNLGLNFDGTLTTGGSGKITLLGTSNATSGTYNYGIVMASNITAADGDITMTGNGGGTTYGYGVYLNAAASTTNTTKTTGAGKLNITGNGGIAQTTGTDNYGVYFATANSATSKLVLNTAGADINITGTGGTGTNSNMGVYFDYPYANGTYEVTSGSGNITMKGYGKGTGDSGYGVFLQKTTITTGSAGTITIEGTGSEVSTGKYNRGITLDYNNTITTNSGNLTLKGTGGTGAGASTNVTTGNAGVLIYNTAGTRTISSTSGNISITGTSHASSTGVYNFGNYIAAGTTISTTGVNNTGTIDIKGTANNASGTSAYGVYIGGNITGVNGNLTVTGQGAGTSSGYGVYLNGSSLDVTGTGLIAITGNAANSDSTTSSNIGLYLYNSTKLATNSGSITLNGTAGKGTSSNVGILAGTGTNKISSTSGIISLKGIAGDGTTTGNSGIDLSALTIETGSNDAINPAIKIEGTGGSGTTTNYGVNYGNSVIKATGSGSVEIKGTGSSSSTSHTNHGITGTGSVTTNSGNITLTGTSGAGGGDNSGYLNNGISITGSVTSTSGNLSLTGKAMGASGYRNTGIYFGTTSVKTGGAGTITMVGSSNSLFAGSMTGSQVYNDGIFGSALTLESGTGKISLDGTAGKGSGWDFPNSGINLTGSITTAGGDIELNGDHKDSNGNDTGSTMQRSYGVVFGNMVITTGNTGSGSVTISGSSSANATSWFNYGIATLGTISISTNSGSINLTGNALAGVGNGTTDSFGNHGVFLNPATGTKSITSVSGDININGTVSSTVTGARNIGSYINGLTISTGSTGNINISGTGYGSATSFGVAALSAAIKTTGTGEVKITGVGSAVSNSTNYGIYLTSTSVSADGGGNITLKGTSTGSADIYVSNGTNTIGSSTKANNIFFYGDSFSFSNVTTSTSSAGSVTIAPRTKTNSVGVAGASGDTQVTATILGTLSTGKVIIGNTDGQGDINVNSRTWASDLLLQNGSGNINVNQAQTLSSNNFSAITNNGGNIGLGATTALTIFAQTKGASAGSITVNGKQTASGTGNAIIMASKNKFVNAVGADALYATNGKWLVYVPNKSDATLNGLTPDLRRGNCVYGSCTPDTSVNALLYENNSYGILTVTATAQSIVYGDAGPSYTYSVTGYEDVADATYTTGSLVFGSSYAQGSNAGKYDITYLSGSLTNSLGYTFQYVDLTNGLTVAKKDITASYADTLQKTYGDTNPTVDYTNFTYSGLYNSSDKSAFTVSTNWGGVDANTGIGTYNISSTLNGGTNYNITNTPASTLTINKRSLTVATDNKAKTYGDADPVFTGSANLTAYDAGLITYTYSPVSYAGNAGQYTIGASASGATSRLANYDIVTNYGTLDVSKRDITATVNNQTRQYGDSNSTYGWGDVTWSNLASGDNGSVIDALSVDIQGTATKTANAGTTHTLSLSGFSDNNYNLTSSSNGTLTISKRDITATVDDANRQYGDDNPTYTYSNVTWNNLANSQDGSVIDAVGFDFTTATKTSNAGTTHDINLTGFSDNNYNLVSFNKGTLTVDKRDITATVADSSRQYGDDNPTLGLGDVTWGNLANGQTGSVIDSFGFDFTTATKTSNAGTTHDIDLSGFSDNNYNLVGVTKGTLSINKRDITATVNDTSRQYGDDNPTLGWGDVTWNNLANSQDGSVLDTIGFDFTTATKLSNAGTTHDIELTGFSDNNYNLVSANKGTLTIDKRDITAVVDDASRQYGDDNPTLTWNNVTWNNLANGQTGSVLDTVGFDFTTATKTSNAGTTHDIDVTGFSDNNYNLVGVTKGTLSIDKRDITATVNDASRQYGDDNPTLGYGDVVWNNLANGQDGSVLDTVGFDFTTATKLSNAGTTHDIDLTGFSDNNYNLVSATKGTLSIDKRDITAVVDDASRQYGDDNPTLTWNNVTWNNLANGQTGSVLDTVGFDFTTATKTSNAGTTHDIDVTGFSDNNYNLVGVTKGTLSIDKRDITAVVDDASRQYGDSNPTLTWNNVTWNNLANSETGSVLDSMAFDFTTATKASNAGTTHDIDLGSFSDNNYNLVGVTKGTLSIDKRDITATVNDASRQYGDDNPTLGYGDVVWNNLANGQDGSVLDTVGFDFTTATKLSNAGTTHSITLTGFDDNNYNLVGVTDGKLTINKRDITASLGSASRQYGDDNSTLGSDIVTWSNLANGQDGSVIDSVSFNVAGTATKAANAGTTHAISISGFSDNNYNLVSSTDGVLSITKRDITANVNDASRQYGDSNPTLGWGNVTWNNLANGDTGAALDSLTLNIAGTATSTANAGTSHAISLSGFSDNNYNLVGSTNGSLVITKRDITASVGNQSRQYGDVNPGYDWSKVTWNNLANSETGAVIDSAGFNYTTASATSNAGTSHDINLTGFSDNNYNLVGFTKGALSITKRDITASVGNASRQYGSDNPVLGGSIVTWNNLVNGDTGSAIDAYNINIAGSATKAADAGTSHAIGISGFNDNNYNLVSHTSGNLSIGKANLQITANPVTMTAGQTPLYTATYSGFVLGQTESVLSAMPVFSTNALNFNNAGTFTITASGAASNNYNISYNTGLMTINPAPSNNIIPDTVLKTQNSAGYEGQAAPSITNTGTAWPFIGFQSPKTMIYISLPDMNVDSSETPKVQNKNEVIIEEKAVEEDNAKRFTLSSTR